MYISDLLLFWVQHNLIILSGVLGFFITYFVYFLKDPVLNLLKNIKKNIDSILLYFKKK